MAHGEGRAYGGLPEPPTTLLALGDIRTGSPEPPIARNQPEPNQIHHIYFFYGQVNYQDDFCEADHMSRILKLVFSLGQFSGKIYFL